MSSPAYRCPGCHRPVEAGAPHFPFCSERCRLVDLGAWFDETYRVSRSPGPNDRADLLDSGEAGEDASSEEADDD